MPGSDQARFDQLMARLTAGCLSADEHNELERLLRGSPALQDAYIDLVGVHLDLVQLAKHPENSCLPHGRLAAPANFRRVGLSLLAAAIAILVVVSSLWIAAPGYRSEPVAESEGEATRAVTRGGTAEVDGSESHRPVIVEAARARIFGSGSAPRPDEPLDFGREYILTNGYLAIRFASGARVVLKAPSVFSPTGPEALLVQSGECSVHAPAGAEGFRVDTPATAVVDLGTRFVVGVAATGETDVHVVEGAASLSTESVRGSRPLLLRQGESAFVESKEGLPRRSKSSGPARFVEELPDRVVRYEATLNSEGFADELLSVAVQRGGRTVTYLRKQLIRSRLTHFVGKAGSGAVFCTRQGDPPPTGTARLGLLDDDWSLVTGVVNPATTPPDGEADPDDTGLEVEFATPVVNGPGPDVLLFDLQVLVHAETGDAVRVVTRDSDRPRTTLEISQFDIDLTSPEALNLLPFKVYRAKTTARSVDDLLTLDVATGKQMYVRAKALVTGIDLSALGYAPGEAARRLMFQKAAADGQSIDPVLVVGLPAREFVSEARN